MHLDARRHAAAGAPRADVTIWERLLIENRSSVESAAAAKLRTRPNIGAWTIPERACCNSITGKSAYSRLLRSFASSGLPDRNRQRLSGGCTLRVRLPHPLTG